MKAGQIKVCITLTLMFLLASPGLAASSDAALSGVVRDAHGVPQLGTLVQLLSADASVIATAFTDAHGRYLIPSVLPGQYQLRATAAFFVPSSRHNVRLQSGTQAIINLTMNTLYEAETWLPAQRRGADESADDWKWALRSSANRPLLRLVDDQDDAVRLSSSAEHQRRASTQARVSVLSGDGEFGQGGTHQILVLDRTIENGDGAIFRADVGGSRVPFPVAPAAEVSAGYERRSPFGGNTRLVAAYQSHPEITGAASNGVTVMQIASTQEIKLGDLVVLDAGSVVRAEHVLATRLTSEPFVRVGVRPTSGLLIEYHYATSRDVQSSEDLDRLKPTLRLFADDKGNPLSAKGSHHELSMSRKLGTRVVEVSAFSDHMEHAQLRGSGAPGRADLLASPLLADPTTASFTLAAAGYRGKGLSVSMVQPVTRALALWVNYDLGTALVNSASASATTEPVFGTAVAMPNALSLAMVQQNTGKRVSYSANASLKGKIVRSGTTLRAQYNWQPERNLTPVDSYNSNQDAAYLGFYLRQRLWLGRLLPEGVDAVIQGTNLLEQGYQPVVAADGHILFLAQAPRSIQGGFAFNF